MSVETEVAELGRTVARHDEKIENLEKWQEKQNGAILRVEAKVDRLIWGILGTAALQLLTIILRGVKL